MKKIIAWTILIAALVAFISLCTKATLCIIGVSLLISWAIMEVLFP